MEFPQDLRYHAEHTWARIEGGEAVVGITDHAQKELGDLVYVELPAKGTRVALGEVFGTVESAKSVSELYSPVTGEVLDVNAALPDSPEWVNDDPYGKGWMIRVRLEAAFDASRLLDAAAYARQVGAK
jgi:glycine cleavage system H protein